MTITTTGADTNIGNGPRFLPQARQEIVPVHYGAGRPPRDLWEALTGGSHGNVCNSAWRFRSALQIECLSRATQEIVRRHAILRCGFKYLNGAWCFVAEQGNECSSVHLDASATNDDIEMEAMELLREVLWRPFCLDIEGPLRVASMRISAEDYLIGFVIHHAFADLASVQIISEELATLYDAFRYDRPHRLRDPSLQYFDYTISLDTWRSGPIAQTMLSEWVQHIEASVPLPVSRGRSVKRARFTLPHGPSEALRELSRRERVGIKTVWEVLCQVTLCRLLERNSIVTLSMHNLRHGQEALDGMIGAALNVVPCARSVASGVTFREMLRDRRGAQFKSLAYRSISIYHILERCGVVANDLPLLNFIPQSMLSVVPEGCDDKGMRADVEAKFFIANPFGTTTIRSLAPLCELTVFDLPEFSFQCAGTVCKPFTPEELTHDLRSVAIAMSENPGSSVESLPMRGKGAYTDLGEEMTGYTVLGAR